jgi:hypothetical protein
MHLVSSDTDFTVAYPDAVLVALPNKLPQISTEVESKRCTEAKRCLMLIDPATEATAYNTQLRASYEMTVAAAIDTFVWILHHVTAPREQERNSLNALMRLCTKVWLECCAQSYRVIVRPATSDGNVLAASPNVVPFVRLLRSPELMKSGQLQGAVCMGEEPVAGWESAVDTYVSE